MIYHPRTPQEAVNLRKEHADTAVYLAGGTDDQIGSTVINTIANVGRLARLGMAQTDKQIIQLMMES